MNHPDPRFGPLYARLQAVLVQGLSADPLEHAEQVAQIAGVLHEAFRLVGYRCTLVGGAAIEIHAPGIYRSGDVDVVLERLAHARIAEAEVFRSLGFQREGRHWRLGTLFVETPPGPVSDPSELVRVGGSVFRIVKKEVVLADRLVGYKQWGYTAYAEQALDMLAAFGDELDLAWIRPKLEYEAAWDAFEALRDLATSGTPVSRTSLDLLLHRLRSSGRTS